MKKYKTRLAGRTNQPWTDTQGENPADAAELFVVNEGFDKPSKVRVEVQDEGIFAVTIMVTYNAEEE